MELANSDLSRIKSCTGLLEDCIYRGLIIVFPYGTYIRRREKTIIVKTKYIEQIIGKNLLLIENKIGFGIIQLGEAKQITLEKFNKLSKKHLITNEDRIKWWPKYIKLYAYPIVKTRFFKIPLLLNYSTGPQITIKPNNIIPKKILVGMSGYYRYMYRSAIAQLPMIGDSLELRYPKKVKNLLQYYSSTLNSLELNSSFYKFPPISSINNLKKYDLMYTIKVHFSITHANKLNNVKTIWKQFYKTFEPIHDKIICFLFQFSRRFLFNQKNFKRLKKLSSFLSKKHRYAFEFRQLEWINNNDVYDLFKKNGWTMVITHLHNDKSWAGDLANGFNPPLKKYKLTSDMIYFRMHGTGGKYWGSYNNNHFKNIFETIQNKKVKYALIYFNNTDRHASAMVDANVLIKKFNPLNRKLINL